MPMAERGAYAPGGGQMAYTRIPEPFWSWKRYRGGRTVPIWLIDLSTYETTEIPHQNASDTFPCWIGDAIYFLSDRNHTMNVFCYDTRSGQVEQLTDHDDFDVRSLTLGDGLLSYEQGGRVHLLDPATDRYNEPFLDDGLRLLPGYARMQGVVTRPDDQREIEDLLADPTLRMVNRNRGAGTRILIDRLLGDQPPQPLVTRCLPGRIRTGRRHRPCAHGSLSVTSPSLATSRTLRSSLS